MKSPAGARGPKLKVRDLYPVVALVALAAATVGAAAAPGAGVAANEAKQPVEVKVHTSQVEGPFRAAAYTNITCDAVYAQATSNLADSAFSWARATGALSYVRCYNWLGDGVPKSRTEWFSGCRVAGKGPNGEILYRWEALERVLDTLLASGVKPFIVCGGLPDVLLEGPIRRNEGGAAANRPADYGRYQDLITQMLRRLVKTYGAQEVRTWYFEVWDQPDHLGSWAGGREAPFTEPVGAEHVQPFNRLYDHFAAAADSVDPGIRIGGPGLAGDVSFLRHFLSHCARGKNSVTGGKGARLSFVSWHRYGPTTDIVRWNEELRTLVERDYPELKGLRFILSECGSGQVEGSRAHTAYEAARLAALVDASARSARGVDMVFRAGDLIDDHFDGFRPLISLVGRNALPLPAFRLYMLLSRMGSERLKTESSADLGVLATRNGPGRNGGQALVYRYDPSILPGTGEATTVRVRFTGMAKNLLQLPLRVYRIDTTLNTPYEAWVAAGSPRPAPPELGRALAETSPHKPQVEVIAHPIREGEAVVELKLAPNTAALVALGAEASPVTELSRRGQYLRKAEDEFNEAAAQVAQGEFRRAIDQLKRLEQKYADTFWREIALYSLVGIYELDLKSPVQAEAARKELLKLPLDDLTRLVHLRGLRLAAVRRSDMPTVDALGREINELETRLALLRDWPLNRYRGQ